uniref:Skp1-related protein n=1 Tax=Steinernema glaseri TaxID=37863 RepID=A0A1I7ZWZ6_9BILA
MYSLLASDNSTPIPISEKAIRQSITLGTLITTLGEDAKKEPIPIRQDDIPRHILEKVVEWCEKNKTDIPLSLRNDNEHQEELRCMVIPEWDHNFLQELDATEDGLYFMTVAANYLEIGKLYRYCCKFIYSNHIKGKSTESIRQYFHEEDDFTPEERKQLEDENKWFT